jgi:hypothetical protein
MFAYMKPLLLGAGLALGAAGSSQAAPVSFDLYVSFLNGPLVGSPVDPFLLTVFYDDDELTYGDANDGDGLLTPWEGLEIVFEGFNVEDLDLDYPDRPSVAFEDFIPFEIDFLSSSDTLPELVDLGIEALWIGFDFAESEFFDVVYDPDSDTYSTYATVIEVAPIPLPAGLPLMALGLGALALAARRRDRC